MDLLTRDAHEQVNCSMSTYRQFLIVFSFSNRMIYFNPRFFFSIKTRASTGSEQMEHTYRRVVSL